MQIHTTYLENNLKKTGNLENVGVNGGIIGMDLEEIRCVLAGLN
jgi:hypothetical protein